MEDPKIFASLHGIARPARGGEEACATLVDVGSAAHHGAGHELTRTGWLLLLMPMDEHMHDQLCHDGRQCVAGAPARWQAAP